MDTTDNSEIVQARRTAELAREAAERANQTKSRFLATASHDLRQPLQTLALLNGSLRRLVTDGVGSELLQQQDCAIAAMSRLLHALLDISKLESGAVKPDPSDFTVATLCEELRAEFASLAEAKGLALQIEPSEVRVRSDRSLVGQILQNLISNAIKYTRTGWVRVRCLTELQGVQIEVLDTGIGIPADQLPHIYDEFYQVTGRAREGYGLGLSIVHRLIKLLNLELQVRSVVGEGSAFSLWLPAAAAARGPAPRCPERIQSPRTATSGKRLLLIEDDPAVRTATRMLLAVEGYEVIAVASGLEALEAVRETPTVDLILSDYHLADGETGPQAIDAVRRALAASVKAVLMTGDTSSGVKQFGADRCLRIVNKPVDADELLALLSSFMAEDRGKTQVRAAPGASSTTLMPAS